jgi:hypothetical protein
MNALKNELSFSIGAGVTFKGEMVNAFISETAGEDENLRKYRQIVLGGVNQVGVIKGFIQNMVNVTYPDGWELPIHPRYLQVLPKAEG